MIHGFIVESRFSHPVNFLAAVMVWFQSLGLGLMHHRCTRLKRDSKREWNRNWKPYCWNTKLGIPPILLLVWFPLPTHIRHIPLPVPVRLDPHAFDPPKNRLGSTVYLSITDNQSTSISIRLSANMAGKPCAEFVEFPTGPWTKYGGFGTLPYGEFSIAMFDWRVPQFGIAKLGATELQFHYGLW